MCTFKQLTIIMKMNKSPRNVSSVVAGVLQNDESKTDNERLFSERWQTVVGLQNL